ncbi:MAG: MATE family efflux transporter [Thermoplasmata archaeon]|nr:MAG: MATE family efflux transporter [Thermoplasmata archaeon]
MKNNNNKSHNPRIHSGDSETEGVKTLLGDPKKGILKLAIPMIIAMSATTLYNVVDAFWVSGLGADALSAVGFFFPFFFIAIAISVGLGIGGGASISRYIGAKNKKGADSAAIHTLVIMLLLSAAFTIPFLIFVENLFTQIGAGDILEMTVAYARIMFAGTILVFFTHVANAILRAEGDAKRAMIAMMFGAGLNIVLDPIFIYTLDFGVAGAAWATVVSMGITSIILFYWLFVKKDTYTSYKFTGFRFNREITNDILKVGVPAMVMQVSMAITMLIANIILVDVGGTDGVAVYSTGWRVVSIGILPILGLATAVVSVTGAAFGAKDYEKLKIAFYYSLKVALVIGIISAVATFVFAPQITAVFTQAEDTARISDDLVLFFMIECIFYPGAAAGIMSSSMFQGVGKGMNALTVTLFRTIIMTPPLMILLSSIFNMGLVGVWWGIALANILGSVAALSWANWYVRSLTSQKKSKRITIEPAIS